MDPIWKRPSAAVEAAAGAGLDMAFANGTQLMARKTIRKIRLSNTPGYFMKGVRVRVREIRSIILSLFFFNFLPRRLGPSFAYVVREFPRPHSTTAPRSDDEMQMGHPETVGRTR